HMATPWNAATKRNHRLLVYRDPTAQHGSWGALFDACLREFNHLAQTNRLGVTLVRSNDPPVRGGGGADVSVATVQARIELRYENEDRSEAFDGSRIGLRGFDNNQMKVPGRGWRRPRSHFGARGSIVRARESPSVRQLFRPRLRSGLFFRGTCRARISVT